MRVCDYSLAKISQLEDDIEIFDLGLIDYLQAYHFQREIFQQVKNKRFKSAVIFCQHHPVITQGRTSKKEDILIDDLELNRRRIKVYNVDRGGKTTYHGPGQLLIYPIFDLNYLKKDIHFFLRWLEELVINILNEFDILAKRYEGLTGIWLDNKKIASIGIAIKSWITYHGLSINVKKDDLENFSLIHPCGTNITMISMEETLSKKILIETVKSTAASIIRRALRW